ncbi:uncharacterized protein LOC124120756 [Haliotis rufescens]|uniref:uncharacterized protein LOC124120756 n=1 Tax=Haliotis rufescens TaxID=6454 RepID=UPI00201F383E|nr:uncharacterized protein LOC124120756 [Haliotis rufescens]
MTNLRNIVIFILVCALPHAVFTNWVRANAVRIADRYNGSTHWSYASSHATGRNTNKCNIFVADVFDEAGGAVPHRWFGFAGPIGAREWGNPGSSYLTRDSCWTNYRTGLVGDVIAGEGHVGIVTGWRMTTSTTGYRVVKNNWGFRPGQSVTYWRYIC